MMFARVFLAICVILVAAGYRYLGRLEGYEKGYQTCLGEQDDDK